MQNENHDIMKISIRTVLAAVILVLFNALAYSQDCVKMYFDADQDGDDLVVRLKVDNFENILTSQFALTYSYSNLELIDLQGNADIELNANNVFSDIPGYISVSWNNSSQGQTLADGSILLEMRFTEIISDISEFTIDPNFNIEFFNAFFVEICFQATPLTINESRTQLVGNLYHDLNNNCIADPNDFPLAGWTVLIDSGLEKYYRVTDAFGHFHIPVEIGSYTVEVIEQNNLWTTCEGPALINVEASGEIQDVSFVLSPISSSSALEVVVSSSEIIRCADNNYSVRYKNNGTAIAQSATIDFRYDKNLSYVSTNAGNYSFSENAVSFNLGNIKPGDGGNFRIVLNASCVDIVPGQTICVEAEISAADIAVPPIEWGGAVLTTKVDCEGDSVAFIIENIGVSPMISPIQSIVVEDDVMFGINEVDLEPQEVIKFKHAASGGVYRVLVNQEEGYPLGNYATDFIEFCNGGSLETYRFVSMFQNEDESPYIDIECQEVKDESGENTMSAFPVGYREEHLVNQNEDIEFTIFFQNVASDTVYNMFITNILDESLNMETLIPGPSSHNYTVSIKEDRKLRIDFNNIQLPNADVNDMASKGFVKFRISQHKDVPIGTKINSTSIIFFDPNNGIQTNLVTHTVGEEFIEIVLNDKNILVDDEVMIAPNPAIETVRVTLPEQYKNLSCVLYDIKGSIVYAANSPSNTFFINRGFIQKGMYILEIRSSSKLLGTKKIVFQD
jgi:hypothetical protein